MSEYMPRLAEALRDAERFVRLTFSNPADPSAAWRKIVVRRVRTPSGVILQSVLHGARKEHAHTVAPEAMDARLAEWTTMGFRNIHLQCAHEDVHIRITKKGRALVTTGRPSAPTGQPEPAHNRVKSVPLPPDRKDAFLEAIGVQRHGRILPSMQGKFRQINRFLELMGHTRLVEEERPDALRIADCGCGLAWLSFAACHYWRDIAGLPVHMTGVDADAEVIAKADALRRRVGEHDAEFVRARILDYAPDPPPEIVLSLHACDTATDEALAQAVRWSARLILAAPCCQHELHHQLAHASHRAALAHGILRERLADVVTDALRAAALRVMGYKADVIEFVSAEDTARNLLIRAERTHGIHSREYARDYLALRDFWGVHPAIERLLGRPFQDALAGGE